MILSIMAKIMFKSAYCERIERIVVKEPAPAISGNTIGVKVASLAEYLFS